MRFICNERNKEFQVKLEGESTVRKVWKSDNKIKIPSKKVIITCPFCATEYEYNQNE